MISELFLGDVSRGDSDQITARGVGKEQTGVMSVSRGTLSGV